MSDQVETKARPLGINHVVLEVDDLDQALEFYGGFSSSSCAAKVITISSSISAISLSSSPSADRKRRHQAPFRFRRRRS